MAIGKKNRLSNFAGILSEEEGMKLRNSIGRGRVLSRKRAKRLRGLNWY